MTDRKDFNITLLFPPVWLPETPYLSMPALSAYLKQAGYNPVQRDLNIEFWQHFYRMDMLKDIYSRTKETYYRLRKKDENIQGLEFMIEFRMMFLKDEEIHGSNRILDFKSAPFPSEDEFIQKILQYDIKKKTFRKLCNSFWQGSIEDNEGIPSDQWESHIKYHDYFFTDISLSRYSVSTKDILQIIDDINRNPYIRYFKKNVIESIAKMSPHLVGISVIAINQVIPAFTLAKLVKEHLPGVHTVLGGPWCTHLHEVLPQKLSLFRWIDSIVVFEGEQALLALADRLRVKKDLGSVPNLIYKEGESIRVNNIINDQDLNLLPPPDFQGLPLKEYELNGMLPLQASRGCSWSKCIFCSYPVIDPIYRTRNPEMVVSDMKILVEKYGAEEFCFTDSFVEAEHFNQISRLILENKIKTRWLGFARIDRKLTLEIMKRMAASGCSELFWGVESGCPGILKLIKKGNTPSLSRRILKYSAKAGIHNKVGLMYGFPTETIQDVKATMAFVEDNIEYIHSLAYNFFTPERNTPIVKKPGNFSLFFEKKFDFDLDIGYTYNPLINVEDLKRMENEFWELGVVIERYHERRA